MHKGGLALKKHIDEIQKINKEIEKFRWASDPYTEASINALKKEKQIHLDVVETVLNKLPHSLCRAVVAQHLLDGKPIAEIAKHINYSRCYCYMLFKRGKERMISIYERL